MTSKLTSSFQQADPTEYATIWGLSQPHLRELLYQAYRSGSVVDDAQRFHASEEFRETVRILAELGKGPGHGYRLLDVGCGNGIACYAFAREGYLVTGCDISEGELAGLAGARSLIGLDGVYFQVINSDMEEIDVANTFDVIYMRQALHHSSDPIATVSILTRLLVPGGIFCAVREHVVLNRRQLQQFLASHPFHHITRDEHAFTLSTYRTAFRRAGLKMRLELFPFDSQINFYPGSHEALIQHLSRKVRVDLSRHAILRRLVLRLLAYKHQLRKEQLYSFFYQKPVSIEVSAPCVYSS